jgi:hypothetical protein
VYPIRSLELVRVEQQVMSLLEHVSLLALRLFHFNSTRARARAHARTFLSGVRTFLKKQSFVGTFLVYI